MKLLKGIRRKKSGVGTASSATRYRFEFKLRAVQLYLEGGATAASIVRETGVSSACFWGWVKKYKEFGEAGLRPRSGGSKKKRLAPAVREKMVEIRRENPTFGVKRIAQILRRVFLLPGSPETVRKTLHEEKLIQPPRKKPQRNITRPRFFERSTPNQLWQTDIFTFRLGGRNAYLLGFIDDFSRYITGLELYRSQTAENVLEVYRRAIGEYNPPKEMLTDNGRQYTNWRGTTRFESELRKDRVKHIKSQPHHPMTLGKIERFWKSIFTEYLARTQFTSFEDARSRLALWVKYYNHKRPHQGIGGLCPADRYFEVQTQLRKTIEQGIQDNILEMALRGQPRSPFYMVGRMEGQSVILRAEKGKLRVTVDDAENQEPREVVYDLSNPTKPSGENVDGHETDKTTQARETSVQCGGESQGGAVAVVGETESQRGVPGAPDQVDPAAAVAGPCTGGDASGAGTEGTDAAGPGTEPSAEHTAGQTQGGSGSQGGWGEAGAAAGETAAGEDPEPEEGLIEENPDEPEKQTA